MSKFLRRRVDNAATDTLLSLLLIAFPFSRGVSLE